MLQVISQVNKSHTTKSNKLQTPQSQKKGEDYPPYATYKYEVEEELAWDYKTCKVSEPVSMGPIILNFFIKTCSMVLKLY